jgi:hypothetical protein
MKGNEGTDIIKISNGSKSRRPEKMLQGPGMFRVGTGDDSELRASRAAHRDAYNLREEGKAKEK